MNKIVLELKNCTKCIHHLATPYPTADSWERAEYYWCKCPSLKTEATGRDMHGEKRRKDLKEQLNLEKLSYVAGYVEWNDEIDIPNECPIVLQQSDELSAFVSHLNSLTTKELYEEYPDRFPKISDGDSHEVIVKKMLTNDGILWKLVKEKNQEILSKRK